MEGTLQTETVIFAQFTPLKNPPMRSGPAVARDIVHDVVLTFGQIVRVVEMLDALRPVGGDDPQFVSARRHLLRFTAQIPSPALKPPKHFGLLVLRLPIGPATIPDWPGCRLTVRPRYVVPRAPPP